MQSEQYLLEFTMHQAAKVYLYSNLLCINEDYVVAASPLALIWL